MHPNIFGERIKYKEIVYAGLLAKVCKEAANLFSFEGNFLFSKSGIRQGIFKLRIGLETEIISYITEFTFVFL